MPHPKLNPGCACTGCDLSATSKVLYGDEDHVITYECYDGRPTAGDDCEFSSEAVMIHSRRRAVNTVERQRLIDIAARLTCFHRDEFVFLQQPGNYTCSLITS